MFFLTTMNVIHTIKSEFIISKDLFTNKNVFSFTLIEKITISRFFPYGYKIYEWLFNNLKLNPIILFNDYRNKKPMEWK
jgi:hypothetical protein